MKTTLRIGLTGGIGSGKSYVARLLTEHHGIPVYDCDREAKRLNHESPLIRSGLIDMAGADVYGPDGMLCRDRLAEWMFADKSRLARVNALIHPVVRADLEQWFVHTPARVAAVESAILYESGFDGVVDTVIYVDAPAELRIQRAMQRDGASREQVARRIAHQHTHEARTRADYVLVNDGPEVADRLREILGQIINE